MLTKAQIKTILQDNLTSSYMFSFQLFLSKLIERETYPDIVSQYRIKNTDDNSYITDIDNFSSFLDENKLKLRFETNYSLWYNTDLPTPFTVIIDNYVVELYDYVDEDGYYINLFGKGNKKIAFVMTYLGDNDSSLPLKIVRIKLI